LSISDPSGGIISGGEIIGQPPGFTESDPDVTPPSSLRITRLGVYGGPTATGEFLGATAESAGSLHEVIGLSDRLSYGLIQALTPHPGESVGLTERLTWALTATYAVTMREVLGMDDRLSGAAVAALTRTLRDGIGLSDRTSAAQQQPYGPAMIALTHFFLDEGTLNYSGHRVIAPAHTHEAKVISFGSIEKEVEIPTGPPRLSDMVIELDDSPDRTTGVQFFRSTFGTKTPRMRQADLLIGPVGGMEHLFAKPAKVTIQRVTFPPMRARVEGSDLRSKWLQKPLPMVINSTNFINLPAGTTQAFFPFAFGIIEGELGALKAIHVDTALNRYTAAFHPVESVEVFTKTPAQTEFQLTPYSYTLVQEAMILEGRENNASYIQFASALPEGTEVRYNIEGVNFRGGWGTLPPITGVSRNVVDHLINILFYIKRLDEPSPDFSNYDIFSFEEVRDKIEALEILSDYAIVEPLTGQEIVTQLTAPPVVHMIPDNFDRIKLVKITDDDYDDAPLIDDATGTLLRSEVISLAAPTYNRYRYRYAYNHATGQWGGEGVYDNAADQEVLGEIEELQVDLYSVSDPDVAMDCVAEWSLWQDHESHRMRQQVDYKTHQTDIELLKPFRDTHYGGLADGGWVEEIFVPYRTRLVIDKPMVWDFDAIRRPIIRNPEDEVLAIGNWAWNHRGGPEYLTTVRRLYECFRDNRADGKKMVVMGSNSSGNLIPLDDGTFPELANFIQSSDSIWVGNKLHIWTQEQTTGRAAYSRFSGATNLYEVVNQTIIASNSHGDCGITGDVQDPSGKPTVCFQGDRELSSGFVAFPGAGPAGYYKRAYVSSRDSGGTWSTPLMMGDPDDISATLWFIVWGDPNYNGAVHVNVGRAARGEANRVHFVFGITEPGDVSSTQDFYIQTLKTDGTLSTSFEWESTGGGGGSSTVFLCGDPCSFEDSDGQFWIAMPIGKLTEPKIALWKDNDNQGAPENQVILSTASIPPDTFGTRCPPIGVRFLNGQLHVLHATLGGPEYSAYKTISEPFDSSVCVPPYTSNPRDIQTGAVWPATTYGSQGFDIKTLRDGHTYIFKATGGTDGVPDVPDAEHIHEKIDVDDLPTSYTLAEFIADNP
jgi:hypothetical protein